MRAEPRPSAAASPPEVPLPRTPLVRVIAQIRFPPILTIRNPDSVAVFQEALRGTYPNLSEDRAQNVDLTGQQPQVSQELIWRFADRGQPPQWRVSLGVDFVALETTAYESRGHFLERLDAVVAALEQAFHPVDVNRLGLRYIDRLEKKAVEQIRDLIHPQVLGILLSTEDSSLTLGDATVRLMTEAQFVAEEGLIQARWTTLPPNTTYDPLALEPINELSWVLDLDMFTPQPQPFVRAGLRQTAKGFAERLYAVFREIVTDEFLRFYGGTP